MTDMKKAFDLALQTEDEGYRLYTEALKKSTHPLGREILVFLANEELKHTRIIKRITVKLAAGRPFDRADIDSDAMKGETIFTAALKNPDARLKGGQNDLDVLQAGVRFETDGIAYFAEAASKAVNPEEKKFFETMAREERAHKRLLESSIEYLENPQGWFDRDSRIILDGA